MKIRIPLLIGLLSLLLASSALAQEPSQKLLVPIGGGYSDTYAGFLAAAVGRAVGDKVKVLVLPIAYAANAQSLDLTRRAEYISATDGLRAEIEQSCKMAIAPAKSCQAVLAPIFVHTDAENPSAQQYFPPDLAAIYLLGDNQATAMQVISGTLVEKALEDAYQRGVLIAATGGSGSLLSADMVAGYQPGYSAANALDFGAVDVWNTSAKHGLLFGLQNVFLDQHFFQLNQMGRLLNAINLPAGPHLGVGVDANTGVLVSNGERLQNVFGLYTVSILDAETYHAASTARYVGPRLTLSVRNVLIHLLSPGKSSYSLATRRHSLADPVPSMQRRYDSLILPKGASMLVLGGDLTQSLENSPVLLRFVNASGGEKASLLVVASGYASPEAAQAAIQVYQAALSVPSQALVVSAADTQPISLPKGITGIVFIAADASRVPVKLLAPIARAWRAGLPLMTDGAATALAGAFFTALPPNPSDDAAAESATQKSFQLGQTPLMPGLGLLRLDLEPQLVDNNRWGRLFANAYNHSDLLAIGVSSGAAIELTADGASVSGDNPVIVLDLRRAKLALGDNQGFVVANGLLDVFAPGERLHPEPADMNAAPIRAFTPVIDTQTVTPSSTPSPTPITPTPTLTSTLRPTSVEQATRPPVATRTRRAPPTPIVIHPPPSGILNSAAILVGVLAVLIVILGVWINRRRVW